jgi:hypothetical protein
MPPKLTIKANDKTGLLWNLGGAKGRPFSEAFMDFYNNKLDDKQRASKKFRSKNQSEARANLSALVKIVDESGSIKLREALNELVEEFALGYQTKSGETEIWMFTEQQSHIDPEEGLYQDLPQATATPKGEDEKDRRIQELEKKLMQEMATTKEAVKVIEILQKEHETVLSEWGREKDDEEIQKEKNTMVAMGFIL